MEYGFINVKTEFVYKGVDARGLNTTVYKLNLQKSRPNQLPHLELDVRSLDF
jgi:hypothetical protein